MVTHPPLPETPPTVVDKRHSLLGSWPGSQSKDLFQCSNDTLRAFLVAQLIKKIYLQSRTPGLDSWVRKIPWRKDRLPTPVFLDFTGGSDNKEFALNVGDLGLIPGSGRSPGRRHGHPLQYSCLENSMDRGV